MMNFFNESEWRSSCQALACSVTTDSITPFFPFIAVHDRAAGGRIQDLPEPDREAAIDIFSGMIDVRLEGLSHPDRSTAIDIAVEFGYKPVFQLQADSTPMTSTRTNVTFLRRLYIAYLIDSGIYTVPAIMDETKMSRRTIQESIRSLAEIEIQCEFVGALKNGNYVINDWGAIQKEWIKRNIKHIKNVLQSTQDN